MTKYLVIIHPPVAEKPRSDVSGSYTVARAPEVKWVTADSPQRAVTVGSVAPGGHALVVHEAEVVRFDRAKEAPLVRRATDGSPLPEAVAA